MTVLGNGSSASQDELLMAIQLFLHEGEVLWGISFVTPIGSRSRLPTACQRAGTMIQTDQQPALHVVDLVLQPASFFVQAVSTLGLSALASWHQQFLTLNNYFITTLRIPFQQQDYVVLGDMTFSKVLYYAPCDRCHRPRFGTAAFAVTKSFVSLANGAMLPLPASGNMEGWVKIANSDSWPALTPTMTSTTEPTSSASTVTTSVVSTSSTSIARKLIMPQLIMPPPACSLSDCSA